MRLAIDTRIVALTAQFPGRWTPSPLFPITYRPGHLHAAFIVAWEVQSQLASVSSVILVGLGSALLALPLMLVWSLVATVVYNRARSRGYPTAMEQQWRFEGGHCPSTRLRLLAGNAIKLWFAGFQAVAFAHVTVTLLGRPITPFGRLLRLGAFVLGLTLFGVSTAEYLLRKGGYDGADLLKFSLLGAFLNVPYRLLLSAALVQGLRPLVDLT